MSPDNLTQSDAQRQLEQVQGELAARRSTLHFAHAAVSLVVGLLLAGATGKFFWDMPEEKQLFGLPGVAAIAVLLVYAAVRYRRGMQALDSELSRFETLKALRRELRLDDPSALLPR